MSQEYATVSINEEFVPSDEKETTVLKRRRRCKISLFHGRWMLNGNDR